MGDENSLTNRIWKYKSVEPGKMENQSPDWNRVALMSFAQQQC